MGSKLFRAQMTTLCLFFCGEEDFEAGALPLRVVQTDSTVMLVHNLGHNGESKTHTTFLRSHKWIEDLLAHLSWNAGASILQPKLDPAPAIGLSLAHFRVKDSTCATHRVVRVLNQVDEGLLAEILIERNRGEILLVSAPHFDLFTLPLFGNCFQRLIEQVGDLQRADLGPQGPRKIEEACDQSAHAIYFARNVSSQLTCQRVRVLQFAVERLCRSLNHAQRIADLVRERGRKLSERSQPFRAARLRLHALELAIGFRQLLRQLLISRGLPAIFESKTIYNHRREKKEQ